jgi:ribose transport system ATP-binding protein
VIDEGAASVQGFFDAESFTDTKTDQIPFGTVRKGATIEIENLSKSFGPRKVLDNLNISIAAGTVHGLLGANGSGKSTAIKILAGYHDPDGAEAVFTVQGERHPLPLTHAQRREIGLAFVHQDLGLAAETSVAENLFIDELGVRPLVRIRWCQLYARASDLLARVGAAHIDPRRKISELFPVDRAIVAIARALSKLQPGGLLVLDEVTTFLPRDSVDLLFDLVRQVCASGMSVLFVSHRLEEVRVLCTSATVLRGGITVAHREIAATTDSQLVTDIVGDELGALYPPKRSIGDAINLEIREVRNQSLGPISLVGHAGEIIGITGLRGMGHEHLPYMLYGDTPASGMVVVDGVELNLIGAKPRTMIEAGVRLVPGDRLRQGAVASATVQENVTLPYVKEFFLSGLLRRGAERSDTQSLLDAYGVSPADPSYTYGRLSGGNQQKVLMARWLRSTPKVLLLDEPTQGVDVGARRELFQRIVEVANKGGTVIYVSTETQDLAELCHRVVVFRDGHVAGVVEQGLVTEENILRACWLNEAA